MQEFSHASPDYFILTASCGDITQKDLKETSDDNETGLEFTFISNQVILPSRFTVIKNQYFFLRSTLPHSLLMPLGANNLTFVNAEKTVPISWALVEALQCYIGLDAIFEIIIFSFFDSESCYVVQVNLKFMR